MFYVYILKSIKKNWFYKEHTSNLDKRLEKHNAGEVRSTKNRRPYILVYQEEFSSRGEAMKREKYFKSLEGGKFIKEYLKNNR